MKKMISKCMAVILMLTLCLTGFPIESQAAGEITIAGIGMGYSAGSYFSTTGKACVCHNKGICVPQTSACTCIHVSGTAQCYAFALWCEQKLFGTNDVANAKAFYSIGSIAAGSVTASSLKNLLYGKAKPGAHIRTYAAGGKSNHSMVIVSIDAKGFTVAQANGSNNNEYTGYGACRIGTSTYTWASYASSTYGSRGISFVKMPNNYNLSGSDSGSGESGSHSINNSYSGFTPFKVYGNSTGKINVYNANGTQYSNRYISGSSDLCTINEVYTDGWCKVTYPSSAEASGYFTAYAKLSEFIPNASPSVATATSGGTAYRRSSGSDSIGSISSGDRCLKVSSANGRIEAIYPVDGQSYSKAGWVAESVFSGSNQGGSAVSSGAYKVPCKAYAISSGKVTVYNASHAAYSISSHYIDGANDLCTINSIGNDGWCQVSYPTSSVSFTAYVPLSTFIPGSAFPQNWTASAKYTAYRRSSGSNTIGSVSSGDACIKVASENGRTQVMYPVSGQNYYKMGWIDGNTGHNPNGVIDGITGEIYSIRMSGWAFDEDNLGAALGIHVYIGDTCIGTGVADRERTDVHKVYGCGNYHGYELEFNLDKKYAGEQTVRVFAINVDGGTNTYLGEKKVTIGSDTEAPVISDYKVTNVTSSGYTVSCTVTDNTGVDRVQFPTWTSYNGQDDIFAEWQINPGASGQKNGNTYTYQVNISAHNYEVGKYNTHIYAYDKYGNASCVGVSVIVPVDVEDIVLNQEGLTFEAAGEEQTLKASVYPENATDKTVKWSSANSAVATVNNGVVKAVGAGETTITATTGNGKKAECTVKVKEKKLTGISIASKPEKVEYYTGDSLDTKGMALTVTYSDGSSQKIQDGFTCTPTVLNTAGTQKITVSYEGKTAVFYVTVKEQPTGAFSVENVSGTQGETVQAVIKMDQNPGIIAARLKVSYDADAMTLTKVEDGGILGEHTFGNNLKANPYTMLWENGTVSSNLTGTGTLAVLTFQIAEDASEGAHDITISYDPDEVYDVDLRNVKFTVSNGTVTVKKADSVVQQGSCGANVTWTLNKDGVLTISGSGAMKNYTYKSEMPWYRYNSQIKTVKIENGVTSIGDYAFYGMPAMKEIVIPDGVKTIGAYAFKNCTALKTAELPSTLTKLGESAFYGCSALTKMNIPEGIYTIWAYTFKNCTSLAEVTLPSTLIKLDEASFYGCSSLEELQIPDQVSIIGIYTFKNCSKLRTVKLPTALTGVREAAFYGTALTDVTLPSKVQTIGSYAFKNCTSLKSVQMPDGLQKIDDSAFYGCTSLVALELPDSVTSINNYAFRRCTGLQKIQFSNGLKTIGECAFYGCTGLTELNLPDSVTEMGSYAFKTCTGVTSIHIPTGVETLKESVFYGCSSVTAVEVPSNVKRIENYVFASCSGLKEIRFIGNMPEIRAYAFARVNAQVQYPTDDATWSKDKMQNYGGQLNWMIPQDNDSKEDAVEVEVPEEQDEVLPDTEENASTEEEQTTGVEEEKNSQNEETQAQPEEPLQEDDNVSKEQNPETEEQEEENTETLQEKNLETVEETMEQKLGEQETVEK